jgi:hypothetical protein
MDNHELQDSEGEILNEAAERLAELFVFWFEQNGYGNLDEKSSNEDLVGSSSKMKNLIPISTRTWKQKQERN